MNTFRMLVLAGAIAAAGVHARAEEMTVVIANSHPYAVMLEMYSQDRDHVWPGGNEAYLLDDGETENVTLACKDEETICYGAWVQGDDTTFWGVGRDNSQSCDSCCYTCDGGATEEINLVE